MQTPKARNGSLEVPQRTPPTVVRSARQLKMSGSDSDSASPHPVSKTPKDRNLKVTERRSPRSPATEIQKKRPGRVAELESQLAQLQEDLKKMADQLRLSESCKKNAQLEAEEANRKLIATTSKLEESEHQLLEISTSEDDRLQELRKLSQQRDRAWESELDALQKQHLADSAALASAISENQRLKIQHEMIAKSEVAQNKRAEVADAEVQSLRLELAETLSLVQNLEAQLRECKGSEAQARDIAGATFMQLEKSKRTIEDLHSDGLRAEEAYRSLASELEQSKLQVHSLQGLVTKLQADLFNTGSNSSGSPPQSTEQNVEMMDESNKLKEELTAMKVEVEQLKYAQETSKIKYHSEEARFITEIQNAYKHLEQTKFESAMREAELGDELKRTKADIEELKANLMDKENELRNISEENEDINLKIERNQSGHRESELEMEMQKLMTIIEDLKANMMDKETELQNLLEENQNLKTEIEKKELDGGYGIKEAVTEADKAKAAESEALTKLGEVTEEVDRSSRRAAWITEQLEAAQAANSEMESELRKLKVQSDQWRKAAEAAAAVLSTERNGKFDYNLHNLSETISSYSDEMDDESPKKKNMLKKLGVLWNKKGQKQNQ